MRTFKVEAQASDNMKDTVRVKRNDGSYWRYLTPYEAQTLARQLQAAAGVALARSTNWQDVP